MMNKTDWSDVDWKSGCTSVLWNGLFVLAALVLFSKTADLFTAFAPSHIFGYTGIQAYYGMVVGVMVEGVFVAAKFMIGNAKNPIVWIWNLALILVTFSISALAQSIDSMVVAQKLVEQPAEIQLAVTWLVPMVPAVVVFLVLSLAIFESFPQEFLPKNKNNRPN